MGSAEAGASMAPGAPTVLGGRPRTDTAAEAGAGDVDTSTLGTSVRFVPCRGCWRVEVARWWPLSTRTMFSEGETSQVSLAPRMRNSSWR